jgi:hypothetical protein
MQRDERSSRKTGGFAGRCMGGQAGRYMSRQRDESSSRMTGGLSGRWEFKQEGAWKLGRETARRISSKIGGSVRMIG